jgi:hypothetical protein
MQGLSKLPHSELSMQTIGHRELNDSSALGCAQNACLRRALELSL